MDKPIDLEDLRRRLAAMTLAQVEGIAKESGVAFSTVKKFRKGHTKEPRPSKVNALLLAMRKPAKATH